MRALVDSRLLFWLLLALPVLPIIASDAIAMDKLHPTGEWSARFLILALAITPLRLLTRNAGWVQWLAARRRYIGVAAFAYAALHLIYYVIDMETVAAMWAEAGITSIWTGWLALILMLALALTSNDASMRALRAGWKRLQRLAYPAAILTLIHWVLIHDQLQVALAHALPLALLEAYRIHHLIFRRRTVLNA